MKKSLALIGLFGTSNDALELEVKECLALFIDFNESLKALRGGKKVSCKMTLSNSPVKRVLEIMLIIISCRNE